MKQKTKKIIVTSLILIQFVLPGFSYAQLLDSNVPVSDSKVQDNTSFIGSKSDIGDASNQAITGGLNAVGSLFGLSGLGDKADKVSSQVNQAIGKIKSLQCITSKAQDILSAADRVNKWTFGGLQLISGDVGQTALLSGKIEVLNNAKDCISGQIKDLAEIKPATLLGASQKQVLLDNLTKQKSTIDLRLESLNAQYANAQQGFWKTLVFNILIKTSKAVADSLVTKLVSNYKIQDFKRYADSVATLVYDNQMIRQTFPNGQSQLMARAILQQPDLRNRIPNSAFVAANDALGFNPTSLNPNDPGFYAKMAAVGSTSANPYFLHASNISGVDQAHAAALAYSQNQIGQSNGYKTPMNCAGSLSQQQAIDTQAKVLNDRMENRASLLQTLQDAKGLGRNVSESDIAKAQGDYNSALLSWKAAPDAVPSSSPALVLCEVIASPVNLINKGIDEAFKAFGAPIAQYNDNNLPSFINLIGDVASQIGSSLIFGGTGAAKNSALINENRVISGGVAALNNDLSANAANAAANALNFVSAPNPTAGTPNAYQLDWFVDVSVLKNSSYVQLDGDGITSVSVKLPLSGSTSVTTTKGGNYTLTVYDSHGQVIASKASYITVPPSILSLSGSTAVLGAYTNKPSLQIRGPESEFNPRGD